MKTWLERADRGGRWLENALLALMLGSLILLSAGQILLRNVFDFGFAWADPMLKVLVLWVGMLGAVAASRENKHIAIDVLSRILKGRALAVLQMVVALFTFIICSLLAWYCYQFVRDEFTWSDVELAGLPIWMWQAILPVGFGLIAWRYLVLAVERLVELLSPQSAGDAQ
ncbi:MAG: TRAP transporter small permease [Gammaproteobacteria bacterium]|nr:TRAP transporter small permease [Gammaproteobacteria bacterium]